VKRLKLFSLFVLAALISVASVDIILKSDQIASLLSFQEKSIYKSLHISEINYLNIFVLELTLLAADIRIPWFSSDLGN